VVVRPSIVYAALAWWPRTKVWTSIIEPSKLKGMAHLHIIGAMSGTPTAAIAVLLGLPPLHIMIEAETLAGMHRFNCSKL